MKLIDILVRGKVRFPAGAEQAVQDYDSTVKFFDSPNLRLDIKRWAGVPRGKFCCIAEHKIKNLPLSEDWNKSIVTREQYEAALAATKDTKMNWKYIKGSEKDFLGAPEWVGMLIIDVHNRKFFTECIPGPGVAYQCDSGVPCSWGNGGWHMKFEIIAQREPVAEWVDGLPPAGVECEVRVGDDKFNLCRIVYSDKSFGAAFVYLGGDEEKYIGTIDCVCAKSAASYFKPLRTEADKKRDEAIEYIQQQLPDITYTDCVDVFNLINSGTIPGVKLDN